jgi:hypothetical protein
MNLETLLGIKKDLELCMQIYGATPEVGRDYRKFIDVLQARYAPLAQDRKVPQSVLRAEISPEVLQSFKPLYDVFAPYLRDFIGKELPPL